MGNTSVTQQPQQTPTTSPPTVATTPAATPNDQAAQTANTERRRKSAMAVPKEWGAALGGLIPPDATGTNPSITLKGGPLPKFRSDTYRLVITDVAGVKQAEDYLADANADQSYQGALKDVVLAAGVDKTGFAQLRATIATLCSATGVGDINTASLRILTTLALTTEDGKTYLKSDDGSLPAPIAAPLVTFAETKYPATSTDEAAKGTHEALIALANAIKDPHSATPGAVATVAPVPLTPAQQKSADHLIAKILSAFPPDKALPANADAKQVANMKASPAQMKALLASINAAEPRVRDHVYAWRDKGSQKGVIQLLGSHLTPSQVEEVIAILDPVEQLHTDLQDLRNGRRDPKAPAVTEYQLLHDFLASHLGDEGTRNRVRDHAVIIQSYVTFQTEPNKRTLMRMIVTGREQPDAVDKLHEAAENGDSNAAIGAIFELGQTPAKLEALRSDLIFVHRLRDKCNERVKWKGIEVKAYDLFLKMCGVDPHETKEAGSIDKQTVVDPTKPTDPPPRQFTPQDRIDLDNHLYNPFAKPLADELDSWYTKDSKVMGWLYDHQKRAAEPWMVEKLRLAKEAPGPTLSARIQACGVNARLRCQKGLSGDNLVQAERILGFVVDQATVGTIGGSTALATDNQVEGGKGIVGLDQALRETLVNGQVLSAIIHAKAQEMADAIGAWFSTADKVRAVWNNYNAIVNPAVCADLRVKTGLPRVWPIEMLANAFLHVGGGSLQSRLQSELGKKHNDVITEMGMQPTDIEARRTLAEEKVVLDNKGNEAGNESALAGAKTQAEQTAKLDAFKTPSAELFHDLALLNRSATDDQLKAVGAKLHAGLAMEKLPGAPVKPNPAVAPNGNETAGVKPGTPAAIQPTDFATFYKREYGMDPTRHAVEIAKALGNKERDAKKVGDLLGIADPGLYVAPPVPADQLKVDETNATLVAPGFDEAEASRRGQRMWDLLHTNGQIQLIRAEIDGRTEEEQRLINIAFRRLSGGIELTFYMQQQAAQSDMKAAAQAANVDEAVPLAVGGAGANNDQRALNVVGTKAESELAVEVAQTGKVSLEKRILTSIAANNMNDVYQAIEAASEEQRRALLGNNNVVNQLRAFGDDSYEWNRIYKSLTGQSDMFDRLESRAHGRHGFLGAFEGTDEKGMTADVKAYARQRKLAITREILGGYTPKKTKVDETDRPRIEARFKAEFQSIFENPSIQAILKDELSGTELSGTEGLIQGAGEENKLAAALTEGDWTEDEEKILADIKKMSPAERKAARENPEYLNQLRKAIQTQGTWRDAMIALQSNEDGSKGDNEDNFSLLEKASRSEKQDTSEFVFDRDDVIQALSRLTPSEYKRLQDDPKLQSQILRSLEANPEMLAMARQMMAFNAADAEKSTGLKTGEAPDPAKGIYTGKQIERLAFLKFGAINRIRAGSSRGWSNLLQSAIAVYAMKLRPSDGDKEEAGESPAAGPQATPDVVAKQAAPQNGAPQKGGPQNGAPQNGAPQNGAPQNGQAVAPVVKDDEGEVEKRLRTEILADTKTVFLEATKGWGAQSATDDKNPTEKKDIDPQKQADIIEQAILHAADPSSVLLLASTGFWGDNEEQIKETLRKASDEQLIAQWTTVQQKSPNGTASMQDKYTEWKAARAAAGADVATQPAPQAAPSASTTPGAAPAPTPAARKPRVGSDEWKKRTAFKAHVLDTSAIFEDLLLKYTGGLFADDNKMGAGEQRVRDNSEWLEWRSIVRDRIPNIERKKIGVAIGAAGDKEATDIVNDPTLSTTLGQLSYDEERYAVDRGESSNYNMDRITAGGEGQAVDNAMGDYRRDVLTSVTAKGDNAGEEYGNITADEAARIAESKERFNQSTSDFRAAKSAVATIASTVVALIITAVVTILTAGTATGPVAVILLGALTAGAASAGTQLTKEAIQGTDFDLGKEGLQNIARDTIMGAVAAGTTWYAGRLASGLWNTTTAAQQAALVAKAAADPSFLVSLGRGMTENALQTGMQGVFETGMAAFDPALWLDGWREGWTRGSSAAKARAQEIPGEMLKAAAIAAISHTAGAGINKLRGNNGGAGEGPLQHAGLGNRASLGERTTMVGSKMLGGVREGMIMGGSEILLDERSWRAEGQKPGEMLGTLAQSTSTQIGQSASNIHAGEAAGYMRAKAGQAQLAAHGHELNPVERELYTHLITEKGQDNDPTVLSISDFKAARDGMISDAIARHEAEHNVRLETAAREKFEAHCRSATTLEDFRVRAAAGPAPKAKTETPDFALSSARDSERQRAKDVLAKLGTAVDAAAPHATAINDTVNQRFALMQEALKLGQKITGKTPAEHEAMRKLVTELNMASTELGNALSTLSSGSQGFGLIHSELKAQLAAIEASPNDAAKYAALHAMVVTAQIKAETGPAAISAAAGSLPGKLAELKRIVEQIRATSDAAARHVANHDGPPTPPVAHAAPVEGPIETAETETATTPAKPSGVPVKTEPSRPALTDAEKAQLAKLVREHGIEKGSALFEQSRAAKTETAPPPRPPADFSRVTPGEVPPNATAEQRARFEEAKRIFEQVKIDRYQGEELAKLRWATYLKEHGIDVPAPRVDAAHDARDGKPGEINEVKDAPRNPAHADATVNSDPSVGTRMSNTGHLSGAVAKAALGEVAHMKGIELAEPYHPGSDTIVVFLPDGSKHHIHMIDPAPTADGALAGLKQGNDAHSTKVFVSDTITDDHVHRALGAIIHEAIARAGKSPSNDNVPAFGQLDAMFAHLEHVTKQTPAAPAAGTDSESVTLAARQASKQESPARISAEIDLLLHKLGVAQPGEARDALLKKMPPELAKLVKAHLQGHAAIGFRADAAITDDKVVRPRATEKSGLATSKVLPDVVGEPHAYTQADLPRVLELRVHIETIKEIDARLAQRDQRGAAGADIAKGESLRRREHVQRVKDLLGELQLGGGDKAYYEARLKELAAVFPGIENDLVPAVNKRVDDRARAETAHKEAEADRRVQAELSLQLEKDFIAGDPFITDRLIGGGGMSGLADVATLGVKPEGRLINPHQMLVVGGPDLIARLDPAGNWGQRAEVFDPAKGKGTAHPMFSKDGGGEGHLQRTVEDSGEFVHVGELNDAMDLSRKKLGVVSMPGRIEHVETFDPAKVYDPPWHEKAKGLEVRTAIRGSDGILRYAYSHNTDLTTGLGATAMPNEGLLSKADREALLKPGPNGAAPVVFGGEQLLQGMNVEGKRVLILAFGPTGAWAGVEAVKQGATRVDWAGASGAIPGADGDNASGLKGVKSLDRTQDAFKPTSNIHPTTDRILSIEGNINGGGAIVTFAHGSGDSATTYKVHYDHVAMTAGFDTTGARPSAAGKEAGPSTILGKKGEGGLDMQAQEGTNAPVLTDKSGRVRVIGPAAFDGVNASPEQQAEMIKRRKSLDLSADSPDARTMEGGGQIAELANEHEKPKAKEPVTNDPTKDPVKEPIQEPPVVDPIKQAASAADKTTGDAATKTTAVRAPVTEGEQASAKQLDASVDKLRETFGPEIAKFDTKLTAPPSDRPVLEQSPSDALIGLPTSIIPAAGSSEEALKQLQKDGIPRWGALTEKERAHETAFASQLEAHLPEFVDEFFARSKDDKVGSYVFEVDGAKKLYAAYGAGKAPEGADQLDVRATANHALHPAAVAIARLAFLKALDQMASLPATDPRKTVFVTNGGCASGKGSLTEIVKQKNGGKFEFGAVWDAAGEGDAQENGWILSAAKSRGIKVTYGFVESDPLVTYNGVLERAQGTGRIVDPVTFARSYVRGQENMREFLASPEYQEALKRGDVAAVGVYTGKFDMATKSFPEKRMLGDDGAIGAKDIKAAPDEGQVTAKSIDIFNEWLKRQAAEGKPIDHWLEGGAVNPLKFGAEPKPAEPIAPAAQSSALGGGEHATAPKSAPASFKLRGRVGLDRVRAIEELLTDPNPSPEIALLQQKYQADDQQSDEIQAKVDADLLALLGVLIESRATEVAVVTSVMEKHVKGVTVAQMTQVFDALFAADGTGFQYVSYAAWKRLSRGRGTPTDIRFITNELEKLKGPRPGGQPAVQRKATSGATVDAGTAQSIASQGVAGAGSALPHGEQIQQAFGSYDIRGTRAQVGGAAAEASEAIGAKAYAQGDRIGFADSPDLHTAAHEAAHIVQQRAGHAPEGGLDTPGDQLEQHADRVADEVVAGRSAEGLLDQQHASANSSNVSASVQRSPASDVGWGFVDQVIPGMGEAGKQATEHSGHAQFLNDLAASIAQSPQYGSTKQMSPAEAQRFLQITEGLIAAEAGIILLAANPATAIVGFVLQLLLLTYLIEVAVEAVGATADAALEWWNACKVAKGNPNAVATAARAFAQLVRLLVDAIIATVGVAASAASVGGLKQDSEAIPPPNSHELPEPPSGLPIRKHVNAPNKTTEPTATRTPRNTVNESCFVAGTAVLTNKGHIPIEELKLGSRVSAFDTRSREHNQKAVLHTHRHIVPVVLDLQLGTAAITCSPEHPFWLDARGWQKACELSVGDNVLSKSGEQVRLASITQRTGQFEVYNITVDTLETYWVSTLDILVHNKPRHFDPEAHFNNRKESLHSSIYEIRAKIIDLQKTSKNPGTATSLRRIDNQAKSLESQIESAKYFPANAKSDPAEHLDTLGHLEHIEEQLLKDLDTIESASGKRVIPADRAALDEETVLADGSGKYTATGKSYSNREIYRGADGRLYYVDNFHKGAGSEIEVFTSNGEHLGTMTPAGVFDPTGKVKGRTLPKDLR